uniref:Putative helicase n=1 Tax=Millerozyma acaciae TaxID=28986 RepID=Q2P9T2_9ASCO|nr:putative helicase [Millerozyma acaciae]
MQEYGLINTFKQQNYILSYLHPNNPYRSLIICYEVGLGKTYASACLSQFYLNEGYKVLYLSNSLNSIDSFRLEYNKVTLDSRFRNLSKNIEYMTFSRLYRHGCDDIYGLIIIDEVHNLRENAIRYNTIKNILNSLIYSKLLLMTATPMIDSVNELDSIIKLTDEEDPKILFSYNDILKDTKIDYIGEKINNEILFLSYMEGIQLEEYKKSLKCDNNYVYTSTRQASISCSDKFNPAIPLKEQSSKIYRLMNELKDDRLTVVFCFYIKRGIDFLASVLEYHGYVRYNSLEKGKTYAIIDGRSSNLENQEILNKFNSIGNVNGKIIHVLIGSSVLTESITLYRVRDLHILSPFWNYGQIEQSIGRVIRYGSHNGLKEKQVNIYLHAACENKLKKGNDIDMINIAYSKRSKINERLDVEKQFSLMSIVDSTNDFIYPEPDNKFVFKVDNWIWDLTECFDHNKFKISWCNIYYDKIKGYDIANKLKIMAANPAGIKINKPLDNGYTIWRSVIDDKLRISYIDNKINKYKKRGKILSNVKSDEINKISKDLNCKNNIKSIIETLKNSGRYFDKQIEYDL